MLNLFRYSVICCVSSIYFSHVFLWMNGMIFKCSIYMCFNFSHSVQLNSKTLYQSPKGQYINGDKTIKCFVVTLKCFCCKLYVEFWWLVGHIKGFQLMTITWRSYTVFVYICTSALRRCISTSGVIFLFNSVPNWRNIYL